MSVSEKSSLLPPTQESRDRRPSSSTKSSPSSFTLVQTTTPLSSISSISINPTIDSDTNVRTILVHATNAFGMWGAGFALALKKLFPAAEEVYKSYCDEMRPDSNTWPTRDLVGRCIIVSPQPNDTGNVWIACLFTSYGYGSRSVKGSKGHAPKDGVQMVMQSTKTALSEFRDQIQNSNERGVSESGQNVDDVDFKEVDTDGQKGTVTGQVGENKRMSSRVMIYSPKFNSGNFGVDWEITAGMIRDVFQDWDGEWRILGER